MKESSFKLRLSIGTKLVGLIAVLLMGSIVSLVWVSTEMFIESSTAMIQQTNADTASNLAAQTRQLLKTSTEKMRILGTVVVQQKEVEKLRQQSQTDPKSSDVREDPYEKLIQQFFTKDPDFLAVFVEKGSENEVQTVAKGISEQLRLLEDPDGTLALDRIHRDPEFSLGTVFRGQVEVSSITMFNDEPALVLAVPFIQNSEDSSKFTHILIGLIRQRLFVNAFSESEVVNSFLVDPDGTVLAHPDARLVNQKENFSEVPIVAQLLSGKYNNSQTRYFDPRSEKMKLGSYRMVGLAGLGVVAEVDEAKAFSAARRVVYRAGLVAWIILCLSFWFGYLYSGTITAPIRLLSKAAHEISAGNFQIHLKPKGRDELAHLSNAFNEMAQGLEERDRVKATFNKFHSKEIAEKLLSGEVKLGGERREAVIFFSDVRGFTSLSEKMEPEEVVELLNEYMTRMVSVIREHRGVVDKYVGDAIMAVWGIPIGGPEDPKNAIHACLAMREELARLNALRKSRKQPVIKIGMGLNMGPLIAGNIGSDEKMEYTVIGDAVNLASRIESMTKEHGTDLLISSSVYEQCKDDFIFEKAALTKVKGKTEAVEIYKVTGYIDESGKKRIIATPYSSYPPERSDKVVHEPGAPLPGQYLPPALGYPPTPFLQAPYFSPLGSFTGALSSSMSLPPGAPRPPGSATRTNLLAPQTLLPPSLTPSGFFPPVPPQGNSLLRPPGSQVASPPLLESSSLQDLLKHKNELSVVEKLVEHPPALIPESDQDAPIEAPPSLEIQQKSIEALDTAVEAESVAEAESMQENQAPPTPPPFLEEQSKIIDSSSENLSKFLSKKDSLPKQEVSHKKRFAPESKPKKTEKISLPKPDTTQEKTRTRIRITIPPAFAPPGTKTFEAFELLEQENQNEESKKAS